MEMLLIASIVTIVLVVIGLTFLVVRRWRCAATGADFHYVTEYDEFGNPYERVVRTPEANDDKEVSKE